MRLGLILKSQGSFTPNMEENRPPKDLYSAVLSRDNETAKPLGFELNAGSTGNSNPVFNSHLVLFQTVPKVALAPIFILWFGFGLTPKILLITVIAFFPILVITLSLIQGRLDKRKEQRRYDLDRLG